MKGDTKGLYDEDGIDGPFERGMAKPIVVEKVCPRCKRIAHPWPLRRADVCSPKDWGFCIRVLNG